MHLGFGSTYRGRSLDDRPAFHLPHLIRLTLAFLLLGYGSQTDATEQTNWAQNSLAKPVTVADGSLNDCVALNIDRYVAVGDRGLVLTTSNGGKSWEARTARGPETLHAIAFSDDQKGLIVGGTVEPMIGRSRGAVLRTLDGGLTWEKLPTNLSRLLGVAKASGGRWIAWGDWSTDYQASVFESIDNGTSWSPVPVSTGHMQAVGVYYQPNQPVGLEGATGSTSGYQAILLDRLGKVFATRDMLRFDQLQLPTSPYQSYRFCKCINGTWWIGGEAGVLYRSVDGTTWEHSFVPGTLQDRELLEFTDINGSGDLLWLVGTQGGVNWFSRDNGVNWQVQTTGGALPLNSVFAGSQDLVLACGEGGRIILSRNGGSSWSLVHESVSKVAALNFASTAKHVGWDVLTFLQREMRQATAAIVVHDQGIIERSSSTPEITSRVVEAGGRAGLISATSWRSLPISDAYRGARNTDQFLYGDLGTLHSPPTSILVRRLVQKIRTYRPEVLISDCPESYGPLQSKLSEAVQMAAIWSGKDEGRLFSKESGIPNEPWTIVRSFSRGTRPGGLHYPRSMLLKSSSLVLGEILSPLHSTVNLAQPDSFSDEEKRVYYHSVGSNSTSLREPLDGLRPSTESQLKDRSLASHKKEALLRTSSWFEPSGLVPVNNFNPLVRDLAWEDRLIGSMKGLELESKAPVLFELGIRNRKAGNWNHWASAMELLISESSNTKSKLENVQDPFNLQTISQQEVPESVYVEAAMLELMRYTGSTEVAKIISAQVDIEEQKSSAETRVSVAGTSSPFARSTDGFAVQPASFNHAPRRIPLAISGGLPEYHRLLSKIPAESDWKRKETGYGWVIASRYRSILTNQSVQGVTVADYPSLWPIQTKSLAEWQSIFQQEKLIARVLGTTSQGREPQNNVKLAPAVVHTASRPYLDGKRSDDCWPTDPQISLRDPWGADSGTTSLYLAQDEEFIYVFAEASDAAGAASAIKVREHDILNATQEQMRLRIDLDRDYATWFEFGWGRNGETSDQLNDIASWNPNWYVATSEIQDGWAAEIAIPKKEILVVGENAEARRLLGGEVWAVSAIHMHPEKGARSVAPSVSDRFQPDSWTLLEFPRQSDSMAVLLPGNNSPGN